MLAYGATFDLTPREKGMKGAIERAAGDRRRDRRRLDAAAVRESRQSRGPPPHHRAGDPRRFRATRRSTSLITGVGTGGHITACAEVLKKAWPELKVFAVEPTLSPVHRGGQPGPHPIQGIGAGFIPAIMDTEPARRRHPGRSPTTPRRWRAARRARKACWSASARARRSPRSRQKLAELGRQAARPRLQLRHRRALSVGARLPARATRLIAR